MSWPSDDAKLSANIATYPMVLFGGLKEVDEKGRPIKLVAQGYIDNFVPGEALTDRLVGLPRVASAKLGYKFWDGPRYE